MKEQAKELLKGAIDVHVHTQPSHFNRLYDDFELASELDRYGMGGCVIKSHYAPTAARAAIANKHAQAKAVLYGAVTLDWPVGGLNPYAAESDLLLGARIVWLPTFHAASHLAYQERKRRANIEEKNVAGAGKQPVEAPGISLLDENGKLLPSVYDIMDVVKKYDAVLATGHIYYQEAMAVCLEGAKRGVTMLVTHPDSKREQFPVECQRELAQKGVYLEKCWLNVRMGALSREEIVHRIKELSPARCLLTTDYGQANNPTPPQGMREFIEALLESGVSPTDIVTMAKTNPAMLLKA